LAIPGCAPSKSAEDPKPRAENGGKKGEQEDPLSQPINVAKGNGTFRDEKTKRDPLWDVEWESSQVQPGDGVKAVLRTVRGKLYTKGKPTTDFEADGARVDQKAQLLILRGHVRLVSSDPKGTLTCDEIRYEAANPKRRVVKARGNVLVVGEVGTVGPTAELWSNPDLTVVATPNLFDTK
jgi:hypothetical protein